MDHLTPEHAAVFGLESVASSYVNRPPYPQAMIDRLRTFGGSVLEVGCGTAECSRRLAPFVERIDAVVRLEIGALHYASELIGRHLGACVSDHS